MDALNYKTDLLALDNAITDQTLADNGEAVRLLAANLNSLYGMMHSREGLQADIFPVNSPERAMKFMVAVHSMAALQFASSIVDELLTGRYSEASALLRSLVELVAYSEYFLLTPEVAFAAVQDVRSLPTRTTVFRKLAKEGRWPVGGPRKAFERYNQSAHAHIAYVLQHTAQVEDGPPGVTRIWLRRYNRESFEKLARHTLLPLFGQQEIYRRVFFPHWEGTERQVWRSYWHVGHDRSVIGRVFPSITLGPAASPSEDPDAA